MTMTNKSKGDDEIQTFKVTFIKSDSNYTPAEMSKIVDTLGRAVLKDIWESLRTEMILEEQSGDIKLTKSVEYIV
ncbi:hypothetical protein M20_1286 [Lactococcus lactis subsp. lactis]|uniref:Uncharacterized protein n=2 Tax=Lactococcus lactis TaxID=1358 RepID=A0A0V8E5P6_LACLL|nr:hypothetical protein M20_1286 [Lactococcus lactis subsp. lactis]